MSGNRDAAAFARIDTERYEITIGGLQRLIDTANSDMDALRLDRAELIAALRGADAFAADLGCTCNMHGDPEPCTACQVRSFTDTSRWTT